MTFVAKDTCTSGHQMCPHFPILSSVSEGVPLTPTPPSPANGPSVPTSYSGVVLRDTSKPPVPRPRSQTDNASQRIETAPAPQSSAPSTPPIPRPRQGSASKGTPLAATSSSAEDTPPALPPKPSQSPPVSPYSLSCRCEVLWNEWSFNTSLPSLQ